MLLLLPEVLTNTLIPFLLKKGFWIDHQEEQVVHKQETREKKYIVWKVDDEQVIEDKHCASF